MEKICLCGCGRTIPDDSNSSYYESRCRQRYSENQKRIISPDETVPRCACGCGELVKKDNAGKWNKYLVGHFKQSRESVLNMIAKRLPRVWTDEQKLVMGEKNHARWLEKSDVEKKLIVEKRRAKSRETKMHRTTPAELAEMVGVHPATIRRWVDNGIIESKKDFRGWRWFDDPLKTVKQIKALMNGETKPIQEKQ